MMANATIVGVFTDRAQAERAVDELERQGFTEGQIGFLAPDGDQDARGEHMIHASESDAGTGERAAKGAAVGVGLGGILAAALALAIPGIGPAVAGGILATALAGAAVG